jgi:predicted nucleic acid-binding protein
VISAVDTNVILDALVGDPRFGSASVAVLRQASSEGRLIASTAVWAEVCAVYDQVTEAARILERMGVDLVPDDREVAMEAGRSWRAYRRAGGTRRRLLTDFLVGAHAAVKADRLVTRDRGFYRSHFGKLQVMDPSDTGSKA